MIRTLEIKKNLEFACGRPNVRAIIRLQRTEPRFPQPKRFRIARVWLRFNSLSLQVKSRQAERKRIEVLSRRRIHKQRAPTHFGNRALHLIIDDEVVVKGDTVEVRLQYCRRPAARSSSENRQDV